jgi:hypothetical protein
MKNEQISQTHRMQTGERHAGFVMMPTTNAQLAEVAEGSVICTDLPVFFCCALEAQLVKSVTDHLNWRDP